MKISTETNKFKKDCLKGSMKLELISSSFFHDDRSDTVFYNFHFQSYLSENKWVIKRRYQDFSDYHSVINKSFYNLPDLPPKTLLKVKNLPDIERRRLELERFLQVVISRSDLMSNLATFYFLDLSNHYHDFKLFQPMIAYEIDDLQYEATTLEFTDCGNLVFVGCMKTNKNSLLNKVSIINY